MVSGGGTCVDDQDFMAAVLLDRSQLFKRADIQIIVFAQFTMSLFIMMLGHVL